MNVPNLVEKIIEVHARNIKVYPQHKNRASSLGGPCERKLVYARTSWDKAQRISPERQLVFDEGSAQENQVLMDLVKAGFAVIENQRSYEDKTSETTGHVDAILLDPETQARFPIEIKSCTPHIFAALSAYDSETGFMKAINEMGRKFYWLRSYPAQIMFYLYVEGVEYGIIIFKNKSSGNLKQFKVTLDLEYLDEKVKRAERINGIVKAGGGEETYPERLNELSVCEGCEFNHICLPNLKFGPELKVSDDPVFIGLLDRFFALKEAAGDYSTLQEQVNEVCKGVENTIVGRYRITGKADSRGAWRKKIEIVGQEEMEIA